MNKKTELQKSWEEFILAVAEELRIIKLLNWITKKNVRRK